MDDPAFYLTTDHDDHWYIVPLAREHDFETWLDIPPDDPAAWDTPSWAVLVNGSPSTIVFPSWKHTR